MINCRESWTFTSVISVTTSKFLSFNYFHSRKYKRNLNRVSVVTMIKSDLKRVPYSKLNRKIGVILNYTRIGFSKSPGTVHRWWMASHCCRNRPFPVDGLFLGFLIYWTSTVWMKELTLDSKHTWYLNILFEMLSSVVKTISKLYSKYFNRLIHSQN